MMPWRHPHSLWIRQVFQRTKRVYLVSNRLEITVFGTIYCVGALHLSRAMVRAGIDLYGAKKWDWIVSSIALEKNSQKLMREVGYTIGHDIKVAYRSEGIVMQGFGFGMEVFHGGAFAPIDMVEAKNRTLQPSGLMKDYKTQDMLGVFWAKRDGAMFYRWEDVDDLDQTDVVLSYEGLAPLLARKKAFELVLDVTWRGKKGRRTGMDVKSEYTLQKHVFHVAK